MTNVHQRRYNCIVVPIISTTQPIASLSETQPPFLEARDNRRTFRINTSSTTYTTILIHDGAYVFAISGVSI